MALEVEDGTGKPNAESYVSVAEADAYHASIGNATWAVIAGPQREILLRVASNYITDTYFSAFVGRKSDPGNGLEWPRYSTELDLLSLGVPKEVKQATAELALVANTTPLQPNVKRGKKRVKIGPLEVEYDGNSPVQTLFVGASLRLARWLRGGSMGGGFARLVRT